MKRLSITVLLCFGAILRLSCQSHDDSLLFDAINKHRVSLDLNKLIWDSSVYKMTSHHAEYLCLLNSKKNKKMIITQSYHTEHLDVVDFEELNSLGDRGKKFAKDKYIKNPYFSFAENCGLTTVSKSEKDSIYNSIFKMWLESKKGHREIMESNDLIGAACSIKYYYAEIELSSGVIRKVLCAAAVLDLY